MGIIGKYKEYGIINPLRRLTYTVIGVFIFIPAFIIVFITANMAMQGWSPDNTYYFGVRPTLIVTNSMEPVIKVNSLVLIEDIEFDEICPGDIIRYNSPQLGYSIVHRVVSVGKECVYTQGDNNPTIDRWPVYPEMLNGKVVEINNDVAPYITLLLGHFDMDNIGYSILRMIVGFIATALLITFILLGFYYLFELITIHTFWTKKTSSMQKSTDWMNDRQTKQEFNELVENYKNAYSKSNILVKIILILRFRKLYDVMCTEEKHAKRVNKYKLKLEKTMKKTTRS